MGINQRKVKQHHIFSKTVVLSLFLLLFAVQAGWAEKQKTPEPPKTRKDDFKETVHGVEIADPYRWLENQDSSETRAWIEAQNAYTESMLGNLKGRENLKKRLTELIKIDVISRPYEFNGRYFFTKRLADQDLPVIYMRQGLKGKDEVLIDPHGMSDDHTVSVNISDITPDGTLMAYSLRQGGEDEVSIHLFDVNERKDLPDKLTKALYFGISVKPDKSGFYYTRHGAKGGRVFYHAMGSDFTKDREIFGEGYGPDKIIYSGLSEDGKHLVIHVIHGSAAEKTEIYYQNLEEQSPIQPIVNDIDAQCYGKIAGDRFFIQTDWKAPKKRILSVDLKKLPQKPSEWKEIVKTGDSIIAGFSTAGGKLFVNYLENVISRVKVFEPDGKPIREISFPAIGSVGGVSGRWDSKEAFFSYSSFHIPPTIYRYNIEKGTQTVWSSLKVPIKSDEMEVKQAWYTSKDGIRIPMFIVHKKGIKLDGSNPTLLTGYGGFNVSLTPSYSSAAIVWVENGGVYVRPNLRGGGEFGEDWHKAAMFEKKQTSFDDFIAASEWLIENKYTTTEKLAIAGGSNGGLLVGAALTQRPDLYKAVACFYPLLDMLRYHQFLMGRFWVSEYGSAEDPAQFKYLYAYSPYHRVKAGTKYPATIFISGDSDTRVAPLHARKMTALLQKATGSNNPVLLFYDTKLGHSGGQPVNKQIEDTSYWMIFLFWQLGMTM